MIISKSFFIPVVCIIIMFFISRFGSRRGWYLKKGNWFSRIMHFSAGLFVAVFWSNLFASKILVVGLTFLVGVFWEIYEYLLEIFTKKWDKRDLAPVRKDWIEDLVMDTLGAIVWILILMLYYGAFV